MPILGKKSLFFLEKSKVLLPTCHIVIFVDGAYNHYTRAYNFPNRTTPQKKFRFRARGHFLGLTPVLALLGHSHVRGISTLDFGPISTKLGGTVRAIKKMTQKDNGPDLGRNYGETGVFTSGRKVVFGLKMGFNLKNHPK